MIKGIKVDSLPFTPELDELVVNSLNGTLENYDGICWKKVVDDNKPLECPDELYSTDIDISTPSAPQ
jgi:hypothetical protein